ncbi:MAG: hypothetical protein GX591_20635 [Planctomycetes bacterium]|nr:hypothetical protein [Planctomycetota bacterium]
MKSYSRHIEDTELVTDVECTLTTGDLDYPGTALEVLAPDGSELFHVVVDGKGQRQVLFYARDTDFRMPLELLDKILLAGKEKVHYQEGQP